LTIELILERLNCAPPAAPLLIKQEHAGPSVVRVTWFRGVFESAPPEARARAGFAWRRDRDGESLLWYAGLELEGIMLLRFEACALTSSEDSNEDDDTISDDDTTFVRLYYEEVVTDTDYDDLVKEDGFATQPTHGDRVRTEPTLM
jgi:hypothetical protein